MLASLLAIALLHWAVLLLPGFNFVLLGQLVGAFGLRLLLGTLLEWRSAA